MSSLKYIFLFILTLVVLGAFLLKSKMPESLKDFFAPVSVVSKVVADGELKSTDGRTNILLLGIDSRSAGNNVTGKLTDTIMIVSIDSEGAKPVIISIPRDLWINETKTKINEVYGTSNYGKPYSEWQVETTINAVQSVSGIPVHYYAIVGFDAFKEAIEAVGGIEVIVDETFDDYQYPVEGKEDDPDVNARYEHIHFDAGRQKMDGETALKYARSRHSTNPREQGDFARARRQQKVMLALKDKVLSADTLFNPVKIKDLYDSYKENVKTDLNLGEALLFYDKYKDVQLGEVVRVVLSNESTNETLGSGTLVAPTEEERQTLYGGKYVLVPINRTFDQIHAIIREAFFKD